MMTDAATTFSIFIEVINYPGYHVPWVMIWI